MSQIGIMKRILKSTLIVLAVLIALVGIAGYAAYSYFNSNFVTFEEEYTENRAIDELTIGGYTFWDRNGNGELDDY